MHQNYPQFSPLSIQQAEMKAAVDALEKRKSQYISDFGDYEGMRNVIWLLCVSTDNFPQMIHQKRFIERKYRHELREMKGDEDKKVTS